ncbi:MAG TPA: hypothetical protein VE619_02850 [Nitrososphaeraceae archaeon]|nr:hypothetical protein [Nitrososphaeraceae archaeon]
MHKDLEKLICIPDENYRVLKQLGTVGDSFNDVMTEILKKIKPRRIEIGFEPKSRFVVVVFSAQIVDMM